MLWPGAVLREDLERVHQRLGELTVERVLGERLVFVPADHARGEDRPPLGGNAIRRSLGPELMSSVSVALRDSIQYALDHREEALAYAMQFARDLDPQLADKFVGMYVNERTVDYGLDGREAVRRLLDMGHKAGIIPFEARVEFVGELLRTA